MTESGTLQTGCLYQFFLFQPKPLFWEAAFVVHRIFSLLWLYTISSTIRWEYDKCNLCLRQMLLAWHKFWKYQNLFLLSRDLAGFEIRFMHLKHFFHPLICPLISKISLELILQDHTSHTYCLEKSLIRTSCGIPGRIKVSNQCGQFILLSSVVILIQRLYKGFIKLRCKIFT